MDTDIIIIKKLAGLHRDVICKLDAMEQTLIDVLLFKDMYSALSSKYKYIMRSRIGENLAVRLREPEEVLKITTSVLEYIDEMFDTGVYIGIMKDELKHNEDDLIKAGIDASDVNLDIYYKELEGNIQLIWDKVQNTYKLICAITEYMVIKVSDNYKIDMDGRKYVREGILGYKRDNIFMKYKEIRKVYFQCKEENRLKMPKNKAKLNSSRITNEMNEILNSMCAVSYKFVSISKDVDTVRIRFELLFSSDKTRDDVGNTVKNSMQYIKRLTFLAFELKRKDWSNIPLNFYTLEGVYYESDTRVIAQLKLRDEVSKAVIGGIEDGENL